MLLTTDTGMLVSDGGGGGRGTGVPNAVGATTAGLTEAKELVDMLEEVEKEVEEDKLVDTDGAAVACLRTLVQVRPWKVVKFEVDIQASSASFCCVDGRDVGMWHPASRDCSEREEERGIGKRWWWTIANNLLCNRMTTTEPQEEYRNSVPWCSKQRKPSSDQAGKN